MLDALDTPRREVAEVDLVLLWSVLLLLFTGLVMVYSSSIATAEGSRAFGHQPSYFLLRHGVFLCIGLVAAAVAFQIPLALWQKYAPLFFLVGVVLLADEGLLCVNLLSRRKDFSKSVRRMEEAFDGRAIESMARICLEAEKSAEVTLDNDFLDRIFTRIDQSIAMAAIWTAHHLKVKAIAALTQSGSTALWMSRLNSGVPIYALTPEVSSRYKMSLYRDVFPLLMKQKHVDRDRLLWEAEQLLIEQGVVEAGDLIVLTIGEPIGSSGGTNTMKIVRVGEHPKP
jgi:hypothetical protein